MAVQATRINRPGLFTMGLGGALGAIGGAGQAWTGGIGQPGAFQNLRNVGGQLTGGVRGFNLVPTILAAETQTLGQSTQGGMSQLPAGTRNGNYVWSGSSWVYNPISSNLPTNIPTDGGGGPSIPGGGDGGGGFSDADITAAYQPYLNALAGFEQQAGIGRGEEEAGVERRYTTESEKIGREKGELEETLAERERQGQVASESAASEARRAFNALVRQGQARFGTGSSAGPAVTELATQEFYRQQGRLGEAGLNLQREITQEGGRIRNYITNKIADLGTWKDEAYSAIKRVFDGRMNEIRLAKGQTEADKAMRRMEVLQQAVARTQAIEDTDRAFKQNLAAEAVQYMAEASAISGRAWGAQDFMNAYNQILGQVQAVPSTTPALGMAQGEGGMAQAFLPGAARRRPEEEALANIPLEPLGVGNV